MLTLSNSTGDVVFIWFQSISTNAKQKCDTTFAYGVLKIETLLASLRTKALANLF